MTELRVERVLCLAFGAVPPMKIRFADQGMRCTRHIERQVLERSKLMTVKNVASHWGLNRNKVQDIQVRYLRRTFSRPRLGHLYLITVDEIAFGHGHRCLTVVPNRESGAVVFVGHGMDRKHISCSSRAFNLVP